MEANAYFIKVRQAATGEQLGYVFSSKIVAGIDEVLGL